MENDSSIIERLYDVTDKFSHGYYPYYRQIAGELGPDANVLELGVFKGGSLSLWQALFPGDGVVVGVDNMRDNYADIQWPAGAVRLEMSQEDPELRDRARELSAEYDLVVDDASHLGQRTGESFNSLWPLVRVGGFYVVEDWFVGQRWNVAHFGSYNGESMAYVVRSFIGPSFGPGSDIAEVRYVNTGGGMAILKKGTVKHGG